ncbi:MAG: HAD family hydrolase [Pseudomonadales bacterium]
MPQRPQALPAQLDNIKYVLSDVDDTITTRGTLLPETYLSMHRLAERDIAFIPITGGCAGWCDSFARLWPSAAVIGENGGFYLIQNAQRQMEYHFWQDSATRTDNSAKLAAVAQRALARFPSVAMAKDQAYRLVDLAIDFNQDVRGVSREDIDAIIALFNEAGANAKASSIHINCWIGDYNKRAMAQRLLREQFGLSESQMKEQVLFIGDSLNDESMFEFFPNSVGVANIESQLAALTFQPRWITDKPHGHGFAQMIEMLCH